MVSVKCRGINEANSNPRDAIPKAAVDAAVARVCAHQGSGEGVPGVEVASLEVGRWPRGDRVQFQGSFGRSEGSRVTAEKAFSQCKSPRWKVAFPRTWLEV